MDDSTKMRKIELDTPEELRFLIANVSAVARQKMDAHLKEDDVLRPRVEELVREYVMRTFKLALPSVSVNAMDAGGVGEYFEEGESEEFEPYDRRLHGEVLAAYGALEKKTIEISTLRREQPAKAAAAYAEQLKKEMEGDERILGELAKKSATEVNEEEVVAAEGEGAVERKRRRGELNVKEVDRREEVEQSAAQASEGLKKLEETLPATAHRLTRAGEALDYVLKQKRAGRS